MIYQFIEVNPFSLVLEICPLLSLILGLAFAVMRMHRIVAPILAFLLPLLFTTVDWRTFEANLDAWILWGVIYALIAYITGWVISFIRMKREAKAANHI